MSAVVKVPVRQKYNNLLTEFGETISTWARTKKIFPNETKQRIYSHIRWTPISPPVDPDEFPTDTAHVLGHEMGLKLHPSDKNYAPWLIVKKSGMGKKRKGGKKGNKRIKVDDEYDAGLGLYAARRFMPGDIITVYFGIRPTKDHTDESRRLEISPGKFIDVLPDESGKRPLYLGAHFPNTPYIDCVTEEDYTKFERSYLAGKNANCTIEGCLIVCTSRVEKHKEFRLDYGQRP